MLLALGKRKLGKQVFVPFLGRIVINFELIILHSSLFSFNFPPFSPVQGGGRGVALSPSVFPVLGYPLRVLIGMLIFYLLCVFLCRDAWWVYYWMHNLFNHVYLITITFLIIMLRTSFLTPFPFGYLSAPLSPFQGGGKVRCSFQSFRKRGTLLWALFNFHSVVIFNTPLPSRVSPRSV